MFLASRGCFSTSSRRLDNSLVKPVPAPAPATVQIFQTDYERWSSWSWSQRNIKEYKMKGIFSVLRCQPCFLGSRRPDVSVSSAESAVSCLQSQGTTFLSAISWPWPWPSWPLSHIVTYCHIVKPCSDDVPTLAEHVKIVKTISAELATNITHQTDSSDRSEQTTQYVEWSHRQVLAIKNLKSVWEVVFQALPKWGEPLLKKSVQH